MHVCCYSWIHKVNWGSARGPVRTYEMTKIVRMITVYHPETYLYVEGHERDRLAESLRLCPPRLRATGAGVRSDEELNRAHNNTAHLSLGILSSDAKQYSFQKFIMQSRIPESR